MQAFAVPEITIKYTDGGDIPDSGNVDFGSVGVGGSVLKNFTLSNDGGTVLTNISASKNGAHAGDYLLSFPSSPTSLQPGGSLTFSIIFSPTQALTRTAAVHITSNDPNENPYDLNLRGIGITPDISVAVSGLTLTDGFSTINFGKVRVGLTGTRIVTIRNTGNSTLSNITLSHTGSAYSVSALLKSSLATGESTQVTLSFTPGGTFTSTGTLRIVSNDTDESPFDVGLTGSGVIPTLEAESPPGTPVYDGSDNLILSSPAGVTIQRQFLLRNVSNSTLTGLALSLDGDGAANFQVSALPVTTLAQGDTTMFTVTFTPPEIGTSFAALHIASDQSFGDPFNIALTGEGITLPDDGDQDEDGLLNMVEVAMGTDPLTFTPSPGTLVKNGENLEFTISRSVAAQATYTVLVEFSDDPAAVTWTTVDISAATIVGGDDAVQQLQFVFPAGNSGHRFARVRVTKP